MKHIYIIALIILFETPIHSQIFKLDFFDAERQGQVDSFPIKYPDVRYITQKLIIRKNATNLHRLKNPLLLVFMLTVSTLVMAEKPIKVYPNPVSQNEVSIESGNDIALKALDLFDMRGTKVFNQNWEVQSEQKIIKFEFPNLESGMYILILTDSVGNKFWNKIIKQ